jgi:hypothetical protein
MTILCSKNSVNFCTLSTLMNCGDGVSSIITKALLLTSGARVDRPHRLASSQPINQFAKLTYWVIIGGVEKYTAHCRLAVVHALVHAGKVRATASAFQGALKLGVRDLAGMCAVVLALTPRLSQKYDDPCGSYGLAGRLPAGNAQR